LKALKGKGEVMHYRRGKKKSHEHSREEAIIGDDYLRKKRGKTHAGCAAREARKKNQGQAGSAFVAVLLRKGRSQYPGRRSKVSSKP